MGHEIKTDCFAYREREVGKRIFKACVALDALYCMNEKCKFYKTKKQACQGCVFDDCDGCGAYVREN